MTYNLHRDELLNKTLKGSFKAVLLTISTFFASSSDVVLVSSCKKKEYNYLRKNMSTDIRVYLI